MCNEARYIRPRLSPSPFVLHRRLSLSLCLPRPPSLSVSPSPRGVVSRTQRQQEDGWRRSSARNAKGFEGGRTRERERVELEARSVIRQVGIHIYRVVKSIGVSVSRVSCKERAVGMRCELIERGRERERVRGAERQRRGRDGQGETERERERAKTERGRMTEAAISGGRSTTEIENGKPPFSLSILPLRPLLLLRHPPATPSRPLILLRIPSPPPPATARIQSLHINPAHNSHFPVWATLRFGCFSYPCRRSEREGERAGE